MNDKTLELLSQLAAQFGTTAEHLWGVLLKQAPIAAINEGARALVAVVLWVWLVRFVLKKTTIPKEAPKGTYPYAEWEDESAALAWGAVAVLTIVVVLWVGMAVNVGMTVIFNPEYWALRKLLP